MLVHLRADLSELSGTGAAHPHLTGDAEFRREYEKLSGRVMGELNTDLRVTVVREVGMLVATDMATKVAMQAARAAAELGVSAVVLGSGTLSTVATLWVGLLVTIIIDYMLDELLKAAGYDPTAKIEALVRQSIDKLEGALLRDPGTFSWDEKGSLRVRMEQLHESRSKLRRESISRLMSERGMR